jgi:hypothetical protein
MRNSVPLILLALVLSLALTSVGTSSPVPAINQTDPTTTVYLDTPTINGTVIGQEFNVSILIRNANNIYDWQAGLTFNASLLNCTGFFEGEFLKSAGSTQFLASGKINNTLGMIRPPFTCILVGDVPGATGNGRLAYATFKVKATGVSNIHLSDLEVLNYDLNVVPINIIDLYTVIVDTTSHTVVTVSNLTGSGREYATRFYDHAFNSTLNETSFKTSGPSEISQHSGILEISGSFCNVTIPKTLLPPPVSPRDWAVLINGTALSAEKTIKSENTTHTSIYFTFPAGINDVQITTRFRPSTISMDLSETSISLGSSVTISGTIDPVRPNVTVTVYNRTKGATKWDTIANVTTNQYSKYTCTWKPGKTGKYEVMASWEGDFETLRCDSNVKTLEVKGPSGITLEIVAVVVVAVIVVAAIIVYFVRIRKPKSK